MRPLFLHPGMGKTATTTLQRALFSHHPEICYLGKTDSPSPRLPKRYASKELLAGFAPIIRGSHLNSFSGWRKLLSEYDLKWLVQDRSRSAANALATHEEKRDSSLISLASWEGILGSSSKRFRGLVQRWQAIRPNVHMLITVREPLSYVTSSYLQTLKTSPKRGKPFVSFERWHKDNRDRKWKSAIPRHYKNIQLAHELLPEGMLRIVPFEIIKRDEREYFTKIAQALGINTDLALDLTVGVHENSTLTQAQYDFLESGAAESATPDERVEIFKQLANEGGKANVPVPESIATKILKESQATNRWLAEVIDMDLATLGYSGIS